MAYIAFPPLQYPHRRYKKTLHDTWILQRESWIVTCNLFIGKLPIYLGESKLSLETDPGGLSRVKLCEAGSLETM